MLVSVCEYVVKYTQIRNTNIFVNEVTVSVKRSKKTDNSR